MAPIRPPPGRASVAPLIGLETRAGCVDPRWVSGGRTKARAIGIGRLAGVASFTAGIAACQLLLTESERALPDVDAADGDGATVDASTRPNGDDAATPEGACVGGHARAWSLAQPSGGTLRSDGTELASVARDGGLALRTRVTTSGTRAADELTLPLLEMSSWAALRTLRIDAWARVSVPATQNLSVVFLRAVLEGEADASAAPDLYVQVDVGADGNARMRAMSREAAIEQVVGPVLLGPAGSAEWRRVTLDLVRRDGGPAAFGFSLDGTSIGVRDALVATAAALPAPKLRLLFGVESAENVPPSGVEVIVDALTVETCSD